MHELLTGNIPSPREVDPRVPPELDAICRRALAPNPDDAVRDGRRLRGGPRAVLGQHRRPHDLARHRVLSSARRSRATGASCARSSTASSAACAPTKAPRCRSRRFRTWAAGHRRSRWHARPPRSSIRTRPRRTRPVARRRRRRLDDGGQARPARRRGRDDRSGGRPARHRAFLVLHKAPDADRARARFRPRTPARRRRISVTRTRPRSSFSTTRRSDKPVPQRVSA